MNRVLKFASRARGVILIATTLLSLWLTPASGVEIIVSMDTSEVMRRADPGNFRTEALFLLTDLLSEKDRIGIVGFAKSSRLIVPLSPAKEAKRVIKKTMKKANPSGNRQDIYEALSLPASLLRRAKGEKCIILLLSKISSQEEQKEKILKQVIPLLRQKGIKLFSVSLSGDTGYPFLEKITSLTGGASYKVSKSRLLHTALLDVYRSIKPLNELPVKQRTFSVDTSVKELQIIATRASPDRPIHLELPTKEIYTERKHPSVILWSEGRVYEYIRIREPEMGMWKIHYSSGHYERVFVLSDLLLQTWGAPGSVQLMKEVTIFGAVVENGERLNRIPLILEEFRMEGEVVTPTGKHETLKFTPSEPPEDGVYSASFTPSKEGRYRVVITGKGKTFKRAMAFDIEVGEKGKPSEKVTTPIEPVAKQGDSPVKPSVEKVEVKEEDPTKRGKEPEKVDEPVQEKSPEQKTPPSSQKVTALNEDGVNWTWVFLRFSVINLCLFGLVFMVVIAKRLKGKRKKDDQD